MLRSTRPAGEPGARCSCVALVCPPHRRSRSLVELMQRHGVMVKAGGFDAAFDAYAAPTVPVTPGSFATPLAVLTSADRQRTHRRRVCVRDPRRAIGARGVAAGAGGGGAGPGDDDRLRRSPLADCRRPGRGALVRGAVRSIEAAAGGATGADRCAVRAAESGQRDRAARGDGCDRPAARDERGRVADRAVSLLSRRQASARSPAARSKRWRASAIRRRSRSSGSWPAIAGRRARTRRRWPWRLPASGC